MFFESWHTVLLPFGGEDAVRPESQYGPEIT
jgi:hypothetical protein